MFGRTKYNYGSHYSITSGKFTVPKTGLYLVTVKIYGRKHNADHHVKIQRGNSIVRLTRTFAEDSNDSDGRIMGSTVVVETFNQGEKLWVEPFFTGSETIFGSDSFHVMFSRFGVTLLSTIT